MPRINELSDQPIYAIKTVSARTGIQPVTLRAWERRYQLLTPQRGDNRYRLYSDQDIAILTWVKGKVDGEMQISAVARMVKEMHRTGHWPEASAQVSHAPLRPASAPASDFIPSLHQSLIEKKEQDAISILKEVRELYELEEIFSSILIPVLVRIGQAWYEGRIAVSTEHFASSLIRGWVLQNFYALPSRSTGKRILVGAGSEETHEIGALMFACLLREKGYFVDYIGPDNPLDDLVDYAEEEKASMVILTASLETNALVLKKLQEKLNGLPKPPIFAYAGQAFVLFPNLCQAVPGIYLGRTLTEGVEKVGKLLSSERQD
jgi:methanogenic corrinoid protein MtbC1